MTVLSLLLSSFALGASAVANTSVAGPAGGIRGFWFGYSDSHSSKPAPSSGWLFNFPGLVVYPPLSAGSGNIPENPSWGSYQKKILTQGGGDSTWGDATYGQLKASLGQYKAAGWDGVCWDWEQVSGDHSTAGFNDLMRASKAAGLINIVTTTAEGPYQWDAADKDARGIDWSAVDYLVPQMYGADGTLPAEWRTYADYWVSGAGRPGVNGVTFAAPPMNKILWGMPADTCDQASSYGGSGCVEWDYDPNVQPQAKVIV